MPVSSKQQNSHVFSDLAELSKLIAGSRRLTGSEFQTVGPATAKARRPNDCSDVVIPSADDDWQGGDTGDQRRERLVSSSLV